MDNIYESSIDAWNKSIDMKEYKTKDDLYTDIRSRLSKIGSGKRYKTDIKDYFIVEVFNVIGQNDFNKVINYVSEKINTHTLK